MKNNFKDKLTLIFMGLLLALATFLLTVTLLSTTAEAKAKKKEVMYKSAKTSATLSFEKCAGNSLIYRVNPDKRCTRYIVICGRGLKKGKIKREWLRDTSITEKKIANGQSANVMDSVGCHKTMYFKVLGKDRKTGKWYQAKKIYKINMRTGKAVK